MNDTEKQLQGLRTALLASGDIAYAWDLVADKIHWFDGAQQVFGLPSLDIVATGEDYHARINPEDLTRRLEALSGLYQGKAQFDCEYRVRQGNGEHHWYHDRGVADYGPDGKPVRLTGTLRPISQRKRNDARLEYLANYDELTGHYNRTRLREALDQALYYSLRYDVVGAFIEIGIDNINMVNQAFGYEVADSVILTIGQRLDRSLRACDMIGRIGGDRFGAVLSNCPAEEVGKAAEKILELARNAAVETPAGPIHVTVSVGVVVFPDSARTGSDAMTKADIALQKAKRAGRNTWALYDYSEQQRRHQRKNMVIAEQVQRALREERLTLAFQPIVCAKSRQPAYHECLLRMIQPDGEIVAAGVFMPVVEELGLIRLVDRKVLELVIDELAQHKDARLAMNVSGITAMDRSWLRKVAGLLRGEPDIASRLVVEITETVSLEDIDECTRFVATLRDLGCQVALDDFGAGYTSFRHLKSLSVDIVKIDGSFIRDIGKNRDNLLFVRTLLDLARNFNLDTVAECVEVQEEVDLLCGEGVHYLQGYAFGKPSLDRPWAKSASQPSAIAVGFGVEEDHKVSSAVR